jgi:uncharacterized protein (TIGR00290 family)
MVYALMSGGGKNSTLALDRARREHLDVGYIVTIYTGAPDRARFHGTPRALVEQQAKSLGLKPIAIPTTESDLDGAFRESLGALIKLDVHGVIFGDISLDSVRGWYEERVYAAGLEHIEPNWGDPSIEIAWEVVERGYQAIVVSVDRAQRATKYLGREVDADMVTEIGCTDGIDPCGERGEYHTFVFDGPAFDRPVDFTIGGESESDGHRLVELIPPTP